MSIILGLKVMISLGAFLGAILATIAVLIIASMQGRMTTSSLILSGTVVNALFLAFSNFIISVGANADSVMTIKFLDHGLARWDFLGRLGPANYSSRNGLSNFSLPSIVFLMR